VSRTRWTDAPNGLWIASANVRPGGVRHLHDNMSSGGFLVPVCSHHSERWQVVNGDRYDTLRPCSECMNRVGYRFRYWADLLHEQGYRPAHFLPPEPIDELVPPRKDPNR